jgi:hypothetical protein
VRSRSYASAAIILLSAALGASCGGNGSSQGAAADLPTYAQTAAARTIPPPLPNVDAGAPPVGDSTNETRLLARRLKKVSHARGIDASRPVPGVVLGRSDLIGRVKAHVAKEIPPEAIRNEGLVLQLFGFIPLQFDYEAAEYKLLETQLAGYYEPADGTMYMAADLQEDDADATLAHELVHALQDMRFDLKSRSVYRPGDGDASSATSALAEGDATSAMFDVMLDAKGGGGRTAVSLPEEIFTETIRESMNSGPTAQSPHVMRTSLASPYIYGTLFVHELRRRGGWDAVNRAWEHAPTTSEQILHVDKFLANEAPIPIAPPSAAALGPGWSVLDADTYGELGTRLTFEEWMTPDRAAIAAANWGGDRGVLLQNGDRVAFAWHLRFDAGTSAPDRFAKLSFDSVIPAVEKHMGKASMRDGAFVCFERKERGPMALARYGRDVVLVLGPARSGATWASAGNCALAKKWTAEIGKSR